MCSLSLSDMTGGRGCVKRGGCARCGRVRSSGRRKSSASAPASATQEQVRALLFYCKDQHPAQAQATRDALTPFSCWAGRVRKVRLATAWASDRMGSGSGSGSGRILPRSCLSWGARPSWSGQVLLCSAALGSHVARDSRGSGREASAIRLGGRWRCCRHEGARFALFHGCSTRGGLSVLAFSGTCPAIVRSKAVLLLLSLMSVA